LHATSIFSFLLSFLVKAVLCCLFSNVGRLHISKFETR